MMHKLIISTVILLSTSLASLSQAAEVTVVPEPPPVTVTAAGTEPEALPLKMKNKITNTTPESEIPLQLTPTQTGQGPASQTGKLFLTLFVLIGMGAAGVYLARKYAYSNKIHKSNMQIKVLSQHHLGAKKSLAIIRVAGESILIGVTDQNISMIKSLALIDDEVPAETPVNFAETMGESMVGSKDITEMASEVEDDFSFAGIKTNVSQKIKSMRNFQ